MNSLTLFLYLADVFGSLGNMLGFMTFMLPMLLGIAGFLTLISSDTKEDFLSMVSKAPLGKLLVLWVFLSVLNGFIPSKDTMYLMAASELGEEVLNTEMADKIEQYLTIMLEPTTP